MEALVKTHITPGADMKNASTKSGDEAVGGNLVLGNMTEEHHYPKQGMGGMAKAAIAAGLLATGGGAVAALPLISRWLTPDPVVNTVSGEGKTTTKTVRGVDRDVKIGNPIILE